MNSTLKPPDGESNASFLIKACKFDNSVHRSWQARLLKETIDLWIFEGVFEKEIIHPLLGVIRPGTISVEYYWKKCCYNVFRFHEPEGELRNFYCNINLPPVLRGDVLSYVDLDIDVLVEPNLSYQIVDEDEFAENSVKHSYPPQLIKIAYDSLAEIIALIENRGFPFDFKN